jgi:putative FmdB family regulatory protein
MPFYEYECSACKFYVEALQKISDPPIKKCPSCKKPTMKKLVSAPVFRLKGSGWYETDFKSDQDKKRNLVGEDKDTSSSDATSEPATKDKADTKSAAETKTEKTSEKATDKASSSNRSRKSAAATKTKAKPKAKPAAKKK